MSRKDKEKEAELRREQAKALMASEAKIPDEAGVPLPAHIGRRRARRYARQHKFLATESANAPSPDEVPVGDSPQAGQPAGSSAEEQRSEPQAPAPGPVEQPAEPPVQALSLPPDHVVPPPPPTDEPPRVPVDPVPPPPEPPAAPPVEAKTTAEQPAEKPAESQPEASPPEEHEEMGAEAADTAAMGPAPVPQSPDKVSELPVRKLKSPTDAEETAKSKPGLVSTPRSEGRASARGLTNGRGATNGTGLINGTGAINGRGLTNGTGMTNGARGTPGIPRRRKTPVGRWQYTAILLALVIIIPTIMFISRTPGSGLSVDGRFDDWEDSARFTMQGPGIRPELSVREWSVQSDGDALFLYLRTEASVMGSSDVSSFYLFVDLDGDASTGYRCSGIGAEYMLDMQGWNESVESSSVSRYSSRTDHYNWSAWERTGSLVCALDSDRLEAVGTLSVILGQAARYLLLSQDGLASQSPSESYPVPEKGGALIVEQALFTSGIVQAAHGTSLLSLTLSCQGEGGTVSGITPVVTGATLVGPITGVSLVPGEKKSFDVLVDLSACSACDLVSAFVTEECVSSSFSEVVVLGGSTKAYVASAPGEVKIDGAFADWQGLVTPDDDPFQVNAQNINITGAACANTTTDTAFYVSVHGEICQGAATPVLRGKPSASAGAGVAVIPTRKSGEDTLRVYIDSDCSNSTGEVLTKANKTIGCDRIIEITGMNGQVVSKSFMQYQGTRWSLLSADIQTANGANEIELSVPSASLGGISAPSFVVETTDWRQRSDVLWNGGPQDPLVVTASGDVYASIDGSSWDYLGAPVLEPGDTVVDVTTNPDKDIIHAVTNSGRVYGWVIGTSTSWSSSLTDPIAGSANVIAIASYADAGVFVLTQDGRPFYDSNIDVTRSWTSRPVIPGPNVDFIDLVWSAGSTDSTACLYAMRASQDTHLMFTDDGGITPFAKIGTKGGKFGPRSGLATIPGMTPATDQLFMLHESGVIRYSSNGATSWTTRGNLPVPGIGNSSIYIGISVDASGNIWAVTDTGYCFKSTDGAQTFVYVGKTPVSPIVGFATPVPIPEFGLTFVASGLAIIMLFWGIRTRKRRR